MTAEAQEIRQQAGADKAPAVIENVLTGGDNRGRHLLYQLKISMAMAESIDIIVSFLMESGVKMILQDLQAALDRGVPVRILTGSYLGITQPSALYLISKGLKGRADLRLYNDPSRSFHPKAYIFHYAGESHVYVGSSNISYSALTSGIEWNYRLSSQTDPSAAQAFMDTFEDLFTGHSIPIDDEFLKSYSRSWHRPAVAKDLERYGDYGQAGPVSFYEPRGAQIEALYALERSREEGAVKGLVHAATGVGKTYLAAFDSRKFKRVLFVAHREEILRQAAVSFANVRKSDDYGFFTGDQKTTDKSLIFASVSSLGQTRYLKEDYFAPDYFDYIVVDEFHHAVTDQYRRIIAYFRPRFLLGLTATPDRMDGRDIYELCDYIVPYEITLRDAINRGILCPFRYYGIYDDTDYSGLHLVRGRYDEKELNETYIGNVRRYDLIYSHYMKHGSDRALGFCCSRKHAADMAGEFTKRGIPSAAVFSGDGEESDYCVDRQTAIRQLSEGKIRVIFSVDMFNEGLDIPSVDMVLFLRPTESPVVFLQQLGRGLRKAIGKHYLTVLDFIGNYEKAGRAPALLSGRDYSPASTEPGRIGDDEYPDDCFVDFDLRLIDLFRRMEERGLKGKEKILREYRSVKEKVGRVPTRMELFTRMDDSIYQLCRRSPKDNPFRNYLGFLHNVGDLTEEEEALYMGQTGEFLRFLEATSMSRSYKMPVLLAFWNGGDVRTEVTEDQLLEAWKEFFDNGTNWKDLPKVKSIEDYRKLTDRYHLSHVLKNPVHFLSTGPGRLYFCTNDNGKLDNRAEEQMEGKTESRKEGKTEDKSPIAIALVSSLRKAAKTKAFADQMKDIIDYRTMEYYRSRYNEASKEIE